LIPITLGGPSLFARSESELPLVSDRGKDMTDDTVDLADPSPARFRYSIVR